MVLTVFNPNRTNIWQVNLVPLGRTRHLAREFAMSNPPSEVNRPDPARPEAPRRVIADWEYRTAYIELFQVRMPSGLHKRLCEWAEQARKSLQDLVIEILEEEGRRREGTSA